MDEAIATIRAKNKDRDVVLAFFKRVNDLREELIKANDELKLMRTDELSHFNDAAQEELRKAVNLLWTSQHNLDNAGIHTIKGFSAHYRDPDAERLG